MSRLQFELSDEHTAMLDGIAKESGQSHNKAARDLLIAVLEDDAIAHGMSPRDPDEKVIYVNWRGRAQR